MNDGKASLLALVCGVVSCVFVMAGTPADTLAADPLAANYTEDVTLGYAPFQVHFFDTSTGTPTAWSWDFGDGTSSPARHPVHSYAAPGVYSVTLVVSDGETGSGKTKTNLITVTYPPGTPLAVGLTADRASGTAPLSVQFSDISVGNPVSWRWDFGDGNTSTQQHPRHSYLTPGNYTVSLTVADGGSPVTQTVADMITVGESPETQIAFREGFENVAAGLASIDALGWTALNNDGDSASDGPVTWSVGYDDTATFAHGGVKAAVVLWNHAVSVTKNDDWLLLPPVTIPAGYKAIYSFWTRAMSAGYLEDFNVKLSTSGQSVADFGVVLGEVRAQNTSWRRVAYDLSDYTGRTVNLAVQYVSLGKYGLVLDDVSVTLVPSGIEGGWGEATVISPNQLTKVQFVDDATGWAVGANGTILKSVDGGATWAAQALPAGFPATETVYGCYFVDANHGWAIGGSATLARIMYTADGGATWVMQTSATQARPTAVFFVDRYNGWICGENGSIQHTVDGGAHWALQTSSIAENLVDIRFVDGNIGWAGGEYRKILHTIDGGKTWTAQSSGLATPSAENRMFGYMDFIDANTGWMVGAEGVILHTTNGGVTWQRQVSNTTAKLTSVDFVDRNYGWIVGANGLVLATVNGGASWQLQASGTTVDLASHVLSGQTSGWAVTATGELLKLASVALTQVDSDGDGVANVMDAFPNDPSEWLDTDFDGIGNNSDTDDDGDGMPDSWEIANGLAPLVAADAVSDLDGDGVTNLAEYLAGTDPRGSSVTISGRLLKNDGAALPGLWVEAASASRAFQAGDESDAAGYYSISVPAAGDYVVSVPGGGTYPFAVYNGKTLWKDATPVNASGGSVAGINFTMSVGQTISGAVSGLGRGRIVSVEAWSDSTDSWGFTNVIGDGGGGDAFTIGGLAPAGDYRLIVRAEEYQNGYVKGNGSVGSWAEAAFFSGGATGVPVVVADGNAISGTITGLSAGEVLWVEAWSEATGLWGSVEVKAAGATTPFILSGLGVAPDYRVAISGGSHGNGYYGGSPGGIAVSLGAWQAATLIDLSEGDVGGLNMVMTAAGSIAGTVSGLRAGDAARITAWSVGGGFAGSARIIGTGATLGYVITGLIPAADYKVKISADGYLGGYYSPTGLAAVRDAALVNVAGATSGVNLSLAQGHSISGVISGLAAGERMWVEASSGADFWASTSVIGGSGSTVSYTLGGLPAVSDLKVAFRAASHPAQILSGVATGANPTGINCVLTAGRSISGTITGAAAHERITVSADSLARGGRESVTVFADAAGSAVYTIRRLGAASDYVLLAETAAKKVFYGNVATRQSATAIAVTTADLAGKNISLAAVTVHTLSGAVNGVADAATVQIDVWNAATGVRNGVTRRGPGLFSLDVPAGNSYRVGFHALGYHDVYYGGLDAYGRVIAVNDVAQAAAVDLSGGDRVLGGLTMTAGYRYGGKVFHDANGNGAADAGEELPDAMVEVVGGGVSRSCTTDSRGVFLLEGLRTAEGGGFNGVYAVAVRSGHGVYSGSMTIAGADVTAVTILIPAN